MLILTNCEVHTAKYLNRSSDVPKEVRRKNPGPNIFRTERPDISKITALLHSHFEQARNFLECSRKFEKISFEDHFVMNKKYYHINFKSFRKRFVAFSVNFRQTVVILISISTRQFSSNTSRKFIFQNTRTINGYCIWGPIRLWKDLELTNQITSLYLAIQ